MDSSAATVSYQRRTWILPVGRQLTVGRSSRCDVRLPDDERLSRRAAVLSTLNDCVLIRNVSTSKPFVLRPRRGEDHVVGPGAAITSLPHRVFAVVLAGGLADIEIHVDASAITPAPADAGTGTRSADTFTSPASLTAAQHRMAVALCRPLLIASGRAARPATYTEIGAALNLKPQYVRRVIREIREILTGYGIPGLTPEDGNTANDDFRLPLARWALWSGWVSAADLPQDDTDLPQDDTDLPQDDTGQ
ncbi:hypothetical protein [Actinoplanes sp. GCM10030250]|uniref:hypothetical protein n=1 Tax=Actinoplanes sp. GCM10030250 TaxID=3273376 RepID=UPI0036187BBC